LAARWEPGRFSPPVRTFNPVLLTVDISGSHWVPSWKPTPVFSQWVRTAQHWFKHYYQLKIHNVFENSIAKKLVLIVITLCHNIRIITKEILDHIAVFIGHAYQEGKDIIVFRFIISIVA
jgi:hypothetical protein